MAYMTKGHEQPGGRWGNPLMNRPLSARSVKDWHVNPKTMFAFLLEEGWVDANPMEDLKPPVHRPDQIQPFTEEQVGILLRAAKRSKYSEQDEPLVLFLLDTGVRASELCGLKVDDVDLVSGKAVVLGKGNKHRAVYFGRQTGRALGRYVRGRGAEPGDSLFTSQYGKPLTRSGLQQFCEWLERAAGISGVRCSPHTFRHTFAVLFLRLAYARQHGSGIRTGRPRRECGHLSPGGVGSSSSTSRRGATGIAALPSRGSAGHGRPLRHRCGGYAR